MASMFLIALYSQLFVALNTSNTLTLLKTKSNASNRKNNGLENTPNRFKNQFKQLEFRNK